MCGAAWTDAATLVVPDVNQFSGHIACSSASRSEIVVPVLKGNRVVGVLDVDSEFYNFFDEVDKKYLEAIVKLITL